jgi:TolB protein
LFLVSASGGQATRLNTEFPNPSEPDWSPDGRTIIYTSQRSGGFDLAMIEVQSGRNKLLVEGEDPSWAPNSRTVIFTRRVGKGNNEKRVLSLLDVPTERVKDTPQISGSRSQPSWAK